MAKLTKEEQARLDHLEAKYANVMSPEEEQRLAELEAKYGQKVPMPSNAIPMANAQGRADAQGAIQQTPLVDEASFAQQRANFGKDLSNYQAPETSLASKAGTAVIKAGAAINPFQDEIAGGIRSLGTGKSASEEIDNVRAFQNGMSVANPGSSAVGTVAGVVGSIPLAGSKVAAQGALGAYQMAGAADDAGVAGRVGMGAIGGALPYGMNRLGGAIGRSALSKKVIQETQGWSKKVTDGVSAGLKRLGFDNAEIRQAAQAVKGKEVSDSNLLVQVKTLWDDGVLQGKNSTVEVAQAIDDKLVENGAAKATILSGPFGQSPLPTATPIDGLPFDPRIISARGSKNVVETTKKLINDVAPNLLDAQGNIKPLVGAEAQAIKEVLQDYRNFAADPNLAKFQQEAFRVVEEHLRNVIETASPELGQLNRVSSAALSIKDKVMKLENAGTNIGQGRLMQVGKRFIKSPLFTGLGGAGIGAGVAALTGGDRTTGMMMGAGIGAGAQVLMSPKTLQKSLSVLEQAVPAEAPIAITRTIQGVGEFLKQNAAALPPILAQYADKFQRLPQDAQEKLAPEVFSQMEQMGIEMQPPKSGYQSEVNGRLTNTVDRLAARQELLKKKQELGILEWYKQEQALNKDGTIPASLVREQAPAALPPPPMTKDMLPAPMPEATGPTMPQQRVKELIGNGQ